MESDTNWSNQMWLVSSAKGRVVEGALDCLSDPWTVAFGLIAEVLQGQGTHELYGH